MSSWIYLTSTNEDMKSNHGFHLNGSSAGDIPVVECPSDKRFSVMWYTKNLEGWSAEYLAAYMVLCYNINSTASCIVACLILIYNHTATDV